MTGPARRMPSPTLRPDAVPPRMVARVLVGLAVVFSGTIAFLTGVVIPPELLLVTVPAAVAVAAGASLTLRSTVLDAPWRERVLPLSVTVAAAAAPLAVLPLQWTGILELIAAIALVALPRWTGVVACIAVTAMLWIVTALQGAPSPAFYLVGVPLFVLSVGVPVGLVRSLRRRDRAREALLAEVESQTRRLRAYATVSQLAGVLRDIPSLSPESIAARVRRIHSDVRAAGWTDADGSPTPTTSAYTARRGWRVALLILTVSPFCFLPLYFVAIGFEQDQTPALPVAVKTAAAVGVLALWGWSVLPRTPRAHRPVAVASLGITCIGVFVLFGPDWSAVLVVFVAAVVATAPRRAGIAVVAITTVLLVVSSVAVELAAGGTPVAAMAEAVYGLPILVLIVVLSFVPRLVAASDQTDDLERRLTDARAMSAARTVAADSHDLLGQSLAAAALRADLAAGTEGAAAVAHLHTAETLIARAEDEARLLADASPHLDFDDELTTAALLLRSTGALVDTRREPVESDDDTHAWVLREATTNILRHSHARHIVITLAGTADATTLTVENDQPMSPTESSGSGLLMMRDRLASVGGEVTVEQTAELFRLLAVTPASVRTAVAPGPS